MNKIHALLSVVIVGRSNVGKSTLFNKIAEENKALVLAESGTTRDRFTQKRKKNNSGCQQMRQLPPAR